MTNNELFNSIESKTESISGSVNEIAEIMKKPRMTQYDRKTIVSELHNIAATNDSIYAVAEDVNVAASESIAADVVMDLSKFIPKTMSAYEYDKLLEALDDWRASIGLPKKMHF